MFTGYITSYHTITSYITECNEMIYTIDWSTLYQETESMQPAFIREQAI